MDKEALVEKYGCPDSINNGIIIQMCKDGSMLPAGASAQWLRIWTGRHDLSNWIVRLRMLRVLRKSSKLRGIKLEEFKAEAFYLPDNTGTAPANEPETENVSNQTTPASSPQATELDLEKSHRRKLNNTLYEDSKAEKRLALLEQKIKSLQDQMNGMQKKKSFQY